MSQFTRLRFKLILLTCSLLAGFGIIIGVYLKALFSDQLSKELLKRGVSIARHISVLSSNAYIEGDSLYLDYLAKEHRDAEDNIAYIFMLDSQGRVLAHSFDGTYPVELPKVNPLSEAETLAVRQVELSSSENVYDIAVPVLDGQPGSVHLGISSSTVTFAVNELIMRILVVIVGTCLVGAAIAILASARISRPAVRLTSAVKSLTRGERSQPIPVESSDEFGQLTAAFNNMIEQLGSAERSLEYQVKFLEILMDEIPTPVFYKDQQGRMLGCNKAYCQFWGYDKSRVIGRSAVEIYSLADADIHMARDREVLKTNQAVRYEMSVSDADGRIQQVVFHKAPFVDAGAGQFGLIGVMFDITKERHAEQMQGEFVSTVAHEFQTPLATIFGFAELLSQDELQNDARQEALRIILNKTDGLSKMVDELLDLSSIESGRAVRIEKKPTDLHPVIVETLDSFRASVSTHEVLANLPVVQLIGHFDSVRVVQVLDNLLSNAVKYSPDETRITVSVEEDNQFCRITIADEGIGMSPEQTMRAFEKFYRVNTSNTTPSGTGLGLFICKAIVDAHGGDIQIDSNLGQGTKVTVVLPKHPAQATTQESILS